MDADCRPDRMTAIVGHELARYNIAVAALSETRRADTGCVKEMGAGYTFWSGKTETEPRVSGVGFAIRNDIASSLTSLPKGISYRIMTLHLSLASKTHLTLISVYTPTMTHPDFFVVYVYCISPITAGTENCPIWLGSSLHLLWEGAGVFNVPEGYSPQNTEPAWCRTACQPDHQPLPWLLLWRSPTTALELVKSDTL